MAPSELEERDTPVDIAFDADVVDVAAGWRHLCVLEQQGLVYCWGSNETGQLGRDVEEMDHRPEPIDGLTSVSGLAAGWGGHSCAIVDDGLYCWGDAEQGQVGDGRSGSGEIVSTPVRVVDEPVSDVAAGLAHTCAVTDESRIYCWGSGESGQLGNGASLTVVDEPTPLIGP